MLIISLISHSIDFQWAAGPTSDRELNNYKDEFAVTAMNVEVVGHIVSPQWSLHYHLIVCDFFHS